MEKINPYFEAGGKTYIIKRTRALESEFERITKNSQLTLDDQENIANFQKLQNDYEEVKEKFENAKKDFFDNPLDEQKEKIYFVFEKLEKKKFEELRDFTIKNSNVSTSYQKIQDLAYENGVKILIFALCEQYEMSNEKATAIWQDFVEHLGNDVAKEWILLMANTLFERDEEETDPFLKQAKAKAEQKMQARKGLSKIVK